MAKETKGPRVLSTAEFEACRPEEVAGCLVSKESFFQLTSLKEMTEPGAAEATYQRWLATGRVQEIRNVEIDPTGLTEDKVEIMVEARFVNAERRRVNVNKREIAKAKALLDESLPASLR